MLFVAEQTVMKRLRNLWGDDAADRSDAGPSRRWVVHALSLIAVAALGFVIVDSWLAMSALAQQVSIVVVTLCILLGIERLSRAFSLPAGSNVKAPVHAAEDGAANGLGSGRQTGTGYGFPGDLTEPWAEQPALTRPARWGQSTGHLIGIRTELKDAIEQDRFSILFQPIFTLDDGALFGCKALARWNSDQFGTVPPSVFMEVAAQTGLIDQLGSMIIDKAMDGFRPVRDAFGDRSLMLEMSPALFESDDAADDIASLARQHQWSKDRLIIEVCARELAANTGRYRDCLQALQAQGVAVAIDGFGTGQGALSCVERIAAQFIKIDRSFVQGSDRSAEKRAIIRSIKGLGNELGLGLIAGGVETADQAQALTETGGLHAHGFFWGRPLDGAALVAQLQKQSSMRTRTDDDRLVSRPTVDSA